MTMVDIIRTKRDGQVLSRGEIEFVVDGVTAGTIPDYQTSALLMAIVLRGMNDEETAWLTDAMARSGTRVSIPRSSVGKHSTGGVGDKVSIMLAPVVAACGVVMPKMSGRGLGHTGGTLDKIESIPGLRVNLSLDEFRRMLAEVGTSFIGQTTSLAPADKKLYALRDVTATVPSPPLIAASVMCKKLAEGASALVLDVKCGDGAFMQSEAEARELARLLVAIGSRSGLRTEAVVTNMDAPLGRAVGNAVEVIECLEGLKGRGPADLMEIVLALAVRVLTLSGRFNQQQAEAAARHAITSGAALAKLSAVIAWQGGDTAVIEDYGRLPEAMGRRAVAAEHSGYVAALRASLLGRASMVLGAGRQRLEDDVDRGAGLLIAKKPGDQVRVGETIVELLYNDDRRLPDAVALVRNAIRLSPDPPLLRPLVLGTVEP